VFVLGPDLERSVSELVLPPDVAAPARNHGFRPVGQNPGLDPSREADILASVTRRRSQSFGVGLSSDSDSVSDVSSRLTTVVCMYVVSWRSTNLRPSCVRAHSTSTAPETAPRQVRECDWLYRQVGE